MRIKAKFQTHFMFSRNVVRRRKRPRLLFATNMCDKIRKCSTYVKTCQASKSRDCGSFAVTRSELCRDLKLPLQQCGDAELPEGVFWVEQERKWRLFSVVEENLLIKIVYGHLQNVIHVFIFKHRCLSQTTVILPRHVTWLA